MDERNSGQADFVDAESGDLFKTSAKTSWTSKTPVERPKPNMRSMRLQSLCSRPRSQGASERESAEHDEGVSRAREKEVWIIRTTKVTRAKKTRRLRRRRRYPQVGRDAQARGECWDRRGLYDRRVGAFRTSEASTSPKKRSRPS